MRLLRKLDLRELVCVESVVEDGKSLVLRVLDELVISMSAGLSLLVGEERRREQFRLVQFKRGLQSLRLYSGDLRSGKDVIHLSGIGRGISDRIDEILSSGTLRELSVRRIVSSEDLLLRDLMEVSGIGESHARRFIDQGVTSVCDLRRKYEQGRVRLTHHMEVGLRYYDDFKLRIPYNEVHDLGLRLKSLCNDLYSDLQIEVCGSHRRERVDSGDIDVLMTVRSLTSESDLIKSRVKYLKSVVSHLHSVNFLVADLTSQGDTKYMGVCMHPDVQLGRRIDIRFVPYDSFYPALLYFTGSMMLNRMMRTQALKRNYTLNEYGLYRLVSGTKEEKLTVNSEREIFDLLGLVYLSPKEREISG